MRREENETARIALYWKPQRRRPRGFQNWG